MSQNIDATTRPQVVHVEFDSIIKEDKHSGRPDENDEGFWPSLDPKAAGWIGSQDQAEFDRQQAAAEGRMRAYECGAWSYIGVLSRATVYVPVGGSSFAVYTLLSPGLWGVESDASDYLKEVTREQEQEMREHLRLMGTAFVKLED